ncbi:DUF192 domain-containing protein [Candidatus Woesearchaeota archaeon]|nr:DUF192 domain-containing protein [Candidatus Woesearchaeota archaeon]
MRQKTAKFLMIFLVVFLLFFSANCAKNVSVNQVWIDNGKNLIKINVEIADDSDEIEKGLMFRGKLNEDAGMLFVFGDNAVRTFWMKNTLIPLDMIFIDGNFEIVEIRHAVPCWAEPCALYKSAKPAKYVLEVNENFAIRNRISLGDKIRIPAKTSD